MQKTIVLLVLAAYFSCPAALFAQKGKTKKPEPSFQGVKKQQNKESEIVADTVAALPPFTKADSFTTGILLRLDSLARQDSLPTGWTSFQILDCPYWSGWFVPVWKYRLERLCTDAGKTAPPEKQVKKKKKSTPKAKDAEFQFLPEKGAYVPNDFLAEIHAGTTSTITLKVQISGKWSAYNFAGGRWGKELPGEALEVMKELKLCAGG